MAHSFIDGTCGRRPMTAMSTTRNVASRPIVTHQVRVETSTGIRLPVTSHADATGGLSIR